MKVFISFFCIFLYMLEYNLLSNNKLKRKIILHFCIFCIVKAAFCINFKGDIMLNNFLKFKRKGCVPCNPFFKKFKFTEIIGFMIAIIGAIIIVQILPIKIWMFILGVLLVILGATLFKLF